MKTFSELVFRHRTKSLANGNLLIEVDYRDGLPGFPSRMVMAEEIDQLIEQAMEAELNK